MKQENLDNAEFGTSALETGQIVLIRDHLGVSTTTLAHMIGVAPNQLGSWIDGRIRPSRKSTAKVGRWCRAAVAKLDEVGVVSPDLVHVSMVSQRLGASYATISDWCGRGAIRCTDLGVLGVYVNQEDLVAPSK